MAKLRKVHVTTGVTWVEAPEAGLFVLCGCPADAVKHLMRRGLIVETERDGVTFETGPNAILLSDVMLQNGTFCNLAEFPVLQMLYRQGMILPGHPNNRGEKPLLIGLREQVEAQLQYIYRGNYGLVNKEELMAAGADATLADELLAMKLKFAFGHIRHPRDLLNATPLGETPVELKGGVRLKRLGFNYFEFSLGDEQVHVDLNLRPGETFEPPYKLGSHRVDRGYFSVLHSGEGDGWDPHRPTMGSVLMFQGRIYLIDAGPNVHHSLESLGIGFNEIDGLFHTHCHDDHFAGLTTLLRADRRIKYFSTPLVRASVTKKLSALLSFEEDVFADCFEIHDLELDRWNDIDGLEVRPLLSPHPVETSVFIFRALWGGGYRSYAHFADIVSLDVLAQMVSRGKDKGISEQFYDKVVADYATPADIKKLDIGGGMIHGQAEDFENDPSGKIILAHTARNLTRAEKEIGSGAPFGTVDVIIPGNHDYVWRKAYEILRTYFPTTPDHELRMLMNSPMVVCNPETILLREGSPVYLIYLVITGTVEVLGSNSSVTAHLSAGAIVGEVSGIEGSPSTRTYRASSFVQALKVPSDLYRAFIKRNGLLDEVIDLGERRNFLRTTWLCAESLTELTLNRLAKDMRHVGFAAGETIDIPNSLALVKSGTAELTVGDQVVETLGAGDFFGEEMAVFDCPRLFSVHTTTPLELYLTTPRLVRSVPIMRWKLLESHERRLQARIFEIGVADLPELQWRDAYSVNVQRFDTHHKNLLLRTNIFVTALLQERGREEVLQSLDFLVGYADYHFREEEQMMERYGYEGRGQHGDSHSDLFLQAAQLRDRLEKGEPIDKAIIVERFVELVVKHVAADDIGFAKALNERGVY